MQMSFFQDMLATIGETGRSLIERSPRRAGHGAATAAELIDDCRRLMSGRGEASGVALATRIFDQYETLPADQRLAFFRALATQFGPDIDRLREAWTRYSDDPSPETLRPFLTDAEPPRQELFRRLNLAPRGTSRLVALRRDVLQAMAEAPELSMIDDDLVHLLRSWFNRGFLVLHRITWSTPADVLERIIRYEAVHTINGWDELQRRLAPSDRRCYAFFHPSLTDEPLIFVVVALTREIPAAVDEILAEDRVPLKAEEATTAVFYSISNCQDGLRGISFGNFLIKQVVDVLGRDLPGLKTFVTLSPAPGFGRWMQEAARAPGENGLSPADAELLLRPTPPAEDEVARLRTVMPGLAAHYFLDAKNRAGKPMDPVARFHLGNGARLDRLNWPGDLSPRGWSEGGGLMVNYLYDPDRIEANHEAFVNQGVVATSPAVTRRHKEFRARRESEARHV